MKTLFISAVLLASATSLASGFVCTGEHFNAKMYNQVQPSQGTKNPAVLVVSQAKVGTIAVLNSTEISKLNKQYTVVYSGQTNAKASGRFIYVELVIAKATITGGAGAGQHAARLTVNADNRNYTEGMVCSAYLKN